MKVVVTGAAGFLGGHLVNMLAGRGDEVRAMVRPGEDIAHLRPLKNVKIVHGDMTDVESLKRVVKGTKRVYHIAAKTGPWGPESSYLAVNVLGLAELIRVAVNAGVQRIVHTSSITVYGHHLRGIITEEHPYRAEDNPYSRTKIAGERLVTDLVKTYHAPIVTVRPAWIYGPRDSNSFARLVALVESGKGFLIGSGSNIVPLVHVRDVAQGLIKAGDAGNEAVGRFYTIAGDCQVTQAQYLDAIADSLHVPRVTRHLPYSALYMAGRAAEIGWQFLKGRNGSPPPITTYGVTLLGREQCFSIEKARRELGYSPVYDITCGVEEGVRWYLEARQGGNRSAERQEVALTR